jgi:hypothetical protein
MVNIQKLVIGLFGAAVLLALFAEILPEHQIPRSVAQAEGVKQVTEKDSKKLKAAEALSRAPQDKWDRIIAILEEPDEPVKVDPVVTVPEFWVVTNKDGSRELNPKFEELAGIVKGGETYIFQAIPKRGEKGRTLTVYVVDGTAPQPPPDIVPPKPDPVPPVTGPRSIVILRESRDTTPDFARTINNLRYGANADYLTSKKHNLIILDVDTKTGSGETPKIIKDWLSVIQGMKQPAAVIFDPATNQIISKHEVGGLTASDVVDLVKKSGG